MFLRQRLELLFNTLILVLEVALQECDKHHPRNTGLYIIEIKEIDLDVQ